VSLKPFARQNIIVDCLFSVCIVAIIRLYSLVGLTQSADLSWETVNALIWCVIEANVGIICGRSASPESRRELQLLTSHSISTLKPFLKVHCPILLGSRSGGVSNDYYSKQKSGKNASFALRSVKAGGQRTGVNDGFNINPSTCNATDKRDPKAPNQFDDGISEDSIMSDHDREGKIMKRTEVVVEYHNSSTTRLNEHQQSQHF
jgi:hypothetical protein